MFTYSCVLDRAAATTARQWRWGSKCDSSESCESKQRLESHGLSVSRLRRGCEGYNARGTEVLLPLRRLSLYPRVRMAVDYPKISKSIHRLGSAVGFHDGECANCLN